MEDEKCPACGMESKPYGDGWWECTNSRCSIWIFEMKTGKIKKVDENIVIK